MTDKQLLEAVLAYIEDTEVDRDGEYGIGRDLQTLIKEDDMPALYNEVRDRLARLNKATGSSHKHTNYSQ
jgi:hypothetical protein